MEQLNYSTLPDTAAIPPIAADHKRLNLYIVSSRYGHVLVAAHGFRDARAIASDYGLEGSDVDSTHIGYARDTFQAPCIIMTNMVRPLE